LGGCRCCYSSSPRSRNGASSEDRSASATLVGGGADDASPVARLAIQELSPSITPCPSAPPCCPPAGRGICGVAPVPAPGSVGVRPPVVGGAVVAPGPPDDFTLHVFVKKETGTGSQ
jgi:hypothetical protein